MSKTLRFGTNSSPRPMPCIDRHVIRGHTRCGYDRVMQLAEQDFQRHVAAEIKPHATHWSRAVKGAR